MQPSRYEFDVIFNYDPSNGLLIPKYNLIVNNARYAQGVALNASNFTYGLNLFNYIGKPIAGNWNAATRELTILGFL